MKNCLSFHSHNTQPTNNLLLLSTRNSYNGSKIVSIQKHNMHDDKEINTEGEKSERKRQEEKTEKKAKRKKFKNLHSQQSTRQKIISS